MLNKQQVKIISVIIWNTLSLQTIWANHANLALFPYQKGRLQLDATWSNQFIADADGLLPVLGSKDAFAYLAGELRGAQSTYLMSPGLGLRSVVGGQIFGAYAYADYQRTYPRSTIWVMNPGVEWISPRLDARVNGYFPSDGVKVVGSAAPAATLGFNQFQSVGGHALSDEFLAPVVAVSRGVDGEVGYSFPFQLLDSHQDKRRARLYAGAYYYQRPPYIAMQERQGVMAGLQVPIKRGIDLLFTDSYDNINLNSAALTLRMTFDDPGRFSNDVHDRLLDRVERHVGILDSGAGMYAQSGYEQTGAQYTMNSNIWFFNPGSGGSTLLPTEITFNDCTADNPCTEFSQSVIDSIDALSPGAQLYLSPGEYTPSVSSILNLNAGQSIWGRTSNWLGSAQLNQRPVLYTPIRVNGFNTIDSIKVLNTSIQTMAASSNRYLGLYVPGGINADPVVVNNSVFQTNISSPGILTAAVFTESGALSLTHVDLISQSTDTTQGNGTGGLDIRGGEVSGHHLNISVTANGTLSAGRIATGINQANSSAKSDLREVNIYVNQQGLSDTIGILNANGEMTIGQSNIEVYFVNISGGGRGLSLTGSSTFNGTDLDIYVHGQASGNVDGVVGQNTSTMNLVGSTIRVDGVGGNPVSGIRTLGTSNMTLNNNTFMVNGRSGTAFTHGFYINSSGSNIASTNNNVYVSAVSGVVFGYRSISTSPKIFTGGRIEVNQMGSGSSFGVFNNIGGPVQFSNMTLDVSKTGGGAVLTGGSVVNSFTASTCIVDGTTVVCP